MEFINELNLVDTTASDEEDNEVWSESAGRSARHTVQSTSCIPHDGDSDGNHQIQ